MIFYPLLPKPSHLHKISSPNDKKQKINLSDLKDEKSDPKNTKIKKVMLENYQEVNIGTSWSTIQYERYQYHGKILVTMMKCKTKKSTEQNQKPQDDGKYIPGLNQNFVKIDLDRENNKNHTKRYRHGPGVLISDDCKWIFAKWSYNKVISNKIIVVLSDLSILELHIQQPEQKQQRNHNVQKEQQDQLAIQQIIFNHCLQADTKNDKTSINPSQHGKNNQISLFTKRFLILGFKQQSKSSKDQKQKQVEKSQRWKWVLNLQSIDSLKSPLQSELNSTQKFLHVNRSQMREANSKQEIINVVQQQQVNNKYEQYFFNTAINNKWKQSQIKQCQIKIVQNSQLQQQIKQIKNQMKLQNPQSNLTLLSSYSYILQMFRQILAEQSQTDFSSADQQKSLSKGFHLFSSTQNQKSSTTHENQSFLFMNSDTEQLILIKILPHKSFFNDSRSSLRNSTIIHQIKEEQNIGYKIQFLSVLGRKIRIQNRQQLHKIVKNPNSQKNQQGFQAGLSILPQQSSYKYFIKYFYHIKYINAKSVPSVPMLTLQQKQQQNPANASAGNASCYSPDYVSPVVMIKQAIVPVLHIGQQLSPIHGHKYDYSIEYPVGMTPTRSPDSGPIKQCQSQSSMQYSILQQKNKLHIQTLHYEVGFNDNSSQFQYINNLVNIVDGIIRVTNSLYVRGRLSQAQIYSQNKSLQAIFLTDGTYTQTSHKDIAREYDYIKLKTAGKHKNESKTKNNMKTTMKKSSQASKFTSPQTKKSVYIENKSTIQPSPETYSAKRQYKMEQSQQKWRYQNRQLIMLTQQYKKIQNDMHKTSHTNIKKQPESPS